jgi:hypothetical protein
MNFIRSLCILNALIMVPMGAVEVTREQQTVYPANPHLVQKAGNEFTPEDRASFIEGMHKASSYMRKISWVFGTASLGSLAILTCTENTAARVVSAAASLLSGAVALCAYKIGAMQEAIARSQELVEVQETNSPVQETPAVKIADGIHIFSDTASCLPCQRLHSMLPKLKDAMPDLAVFEYETNNTETQTLIKSLGINILSIPLTVVIKNGAIVRLIPGYSNLNDFMQKVSTALN